MTMGNAMLSPVLNSIPFGTTVKFIGMGITPPQTVFETFRPADYAGFVEDIRKKRAHFTAYARDPSRFEVPVYDFGVLDYEFIEDDAVTSAKSDADDLELTFKDYPNPSLVYMFRVADGCLPNCPYLVHVDYLNQTAEVFFLSQAGWSGLGAIKDLDIRAKIIEEVEAYTFMFRLLLNVWRSDVEYREVVSPTALKVNKTRALNRKPPLQPVRVIDLKKTRIEYLRSREERHAARATGKQCQHVRTITDQWVFPKTPGARQFKPYRRKAQTIIVGSPGKVGEYRHKVTRVIT